MISPEATAKAVWDMIMFVIIIYQAIMIPFNLSFENIQGSAVIEVLDYIQDLMFATDILLNFNTGFYKNGLLVLNRKAVIIYYLKTWFVIDILSTFPYSLIMDLFGESSSLDSSQSKLAAKTPQLLRLLKIVRFLRFLKLLRVLKLSKALAKYEEFFYNDKVNILQAFGKIFILISFFAHCLACMFWGVGSNSSS